MGFYSFLFLFLRYAIFGCLWEVSSCWSAFWVVCSVVVVVFSRLQPIFDGFYSLPPSFRLCFLVGGVNGGGGWLVGGAKVGRLSAAGARIARLFIRPPTLTSRVSDRER
jgi:hypothetical protein